MNLKTLLASTFSVFSAFSMATSSGWATPPEQKAHARDVVGYLHRMPEGGLAIDVPSQLQGAIRYLLKGPEISSLETKLPPNIRFPTQGDLSTDGDTSATLQEMLGGGGFKRSETRFSPVAVAVRGNFGEILSVAPDTVMGGAAKEREPRLPQGGVLYEIEVTQVHWVVDRSEWSKLSKLAAPHLAAAAKGAEERDFAGVLLALDQASKIFGKHFSTKANLVPDYHLLKSLSASLAEEMPRASRGYFMATAVCDRMRERVKRDSRNGTFLPILQAFESCAVKGYENIVKRAPGAMKGYNEADAYDAAARLLFFLQQQSPEIKGRETVLKQAVKNIGVAQPQLFPPRWVEMGKK